MGIARFTVLVVCLAVVGCGRPTEEPAVQASEVTKTKPQEKNTGSVAEMVRRGHFGRSLGLVEGFDYRWEKQLPKGQRRVDVMLRALSVKSQLSELSQQLVMAYYEATDKYSSNSEEDKRRIHNFMRLAFDDLWMAYYKMPQELVRDQTNNMVMAFKFGLEDENGVVRLETPEQVRAAALLLTQRRKQPEVKDALRRHLEQAGSVWVPELDENGEETGRSITGESLGDRASLRPAIVSHIDTSMAQAIAGGHLEGLSRKDCATVVNMKPVELSAAEAELRKSESGEVAWQYAVDFVERMEAAFALSNKVLEISYTVRSGDRDGHKRFIEEDFEALATTSRVLTPRYLHLVSGWTATSDEIDKLLKSPEVDGYGEKFRTRLQEYLDDNRGHPERQKIVSLANRLDGMSSHAGANQDTAKPVLGRLEIEQSALEEISKRPAHTNRAIIRRQELVERYVRAGCDGKAIAAILGQISRTYTNMKGVHGDIFTLSVEEFEYYQENRSLLSNYSQNENDVVASLSLLRRGIIDDLAKLGRDGVDEIMLHLSYSGYLSQMITSLLDVNGRPNYQYDRPMEAVRNTVVLRLTELAKNSPEEHKWIEERLVSALESCPQSREQSEKKRQGLERDDFLRTVNVYEKNLEVAIELFRKKMESDDFEIDLAPSAVQDSPRRSFEVYE